MTDWFGGNNPPAQIHAGNDLLEPGTRGQHKALRKAARSGALSLEDIDTSVRRILKLILNSPKMESYNHSNHPDLIAHARVTRQSASEGMVLLKNEGILPLEGINNIALFGATSYDFIAGGTGSGDVNEAYTVSLEEGLLNAGFEINEGARDLFEAYKAAHEEEFEKPEGLLNAVMNPYAPPEITLTAEQVKKVAGTADVAIVTIGRNSGEGGDRVEKDDFLLSSEEQEMLSTICKTFHASGKKVVVVLNIGGVIETASWKNLPDAILLAWQGGQESGNSVADILRGEVNPSGRLPMTFPVALEDHASSANFPMDGAPISFAPMLLRTKDKPAEELVPNVDFTTYEEGIYVGYRHFDKANLKVSYPFGYGLSYTEFSYKDMDIMLIDGNIHISVQVENTGNAAGKEVVEIYVSKPHTKIDCAVQELKAFVKTPLLESGKSTEVHMSIPRENLSYWNEVDSCWTLEKGPYTIHAGASSRDLRLAEEISL